MASPAFSESLSACFASKGMLRRGRRTPKTIVQVYSNPSLLNKEGMKVWFFLFLAVVVVGCILLQSPTQERMTCSRPVLGPASNPSMYGPGDDPSSTFSSSSTQRLSNKHPGCRVGNNGIVCDDGKFSSDTATRNPQYLPVYTYSPPLERAFPVEEGGPQPYLNNFDRIGR